MPSFSKRSLERLETCVPELQLVMHEAILEYDFTVLCGHRGMEDQEKAFRDGNSRVHWPHGKHNSMPSKAVDVAPWFEEEPHIRWDDLVSFGVLAEVILRVAERMGIKLRWGGKWKMRDYVHFETVE